MINQYASKVVREDFINAMAKHYPEGLKEVSQKAEQMSLSKEDEYISCTCSKYDHPLFDFPTNADLYD